MGMFNIYDEMAKQQDVGSGYGKLGLGRVATEVAGQTGAGMAGAAMQGMGFKTAAQERNENIMRVRQQFPNPQTAEQFRELGNALNAIGEVDYAEKAFDNAKDLTTTSSSDMKKWQFVTASHRQAIKDYAISKNKRLSERQLDNLVSVTKSKASLHPTLVENVHPWKDIVDQTLAGMKTVPGVSQGGSSVLHHSVTQTDATQKVIDKELDKKVTALSTDLNKVGGADMALQQLERKMEKYIDSKTGKLIADIPGFSEWETYIRSAEGDDFSALWENLLGEVRHERFGSVLTANEQKMFEKIKTGNPYYLTDEAVLNYVKRMRETIDDKKAKIRKGYANNVTSRYDSRGKVENKTNSLSKEETDLILKYLPK